MTRSYEGGRTHSTTWLQTPTAHVADVSARAGRGLWWEGHTCAGSATWEGITRWGLLFFPDFCKAVHTAKMPLMHGAGGFLPLMHGAGGFLQGSSRMQFFFKKIRTIQPGSVLDKRTEFRFRPDHPFGREVVLCQVLGKCWVALS